MIGRLRGVFQVNENYDGKIKRHRLPRLAIRFTGTSTITADVGAREVVTGATSNTLDLTSVTWPCSGSDTGCVSNFTLRGIRGFLAYAPSTNTGRATITDGTYPLLRGGTLWLDPNSVCVAYFRGDRPAVSANEKTISIALNNASDSVELVLIGGT